MGERGPVPAPLSRRSQVRRRQAERGRAGIVPAGVDRPVPVAPVDLGGPGLELWGDAWSLAWVHEGDRAAVLDLCRLVAERASMAAERERLGWTLTEPIVTPKGDVVGSRVVANPLTAQISRIDGLIGSARAQLGLTPMARARLGLVVVMAEGRLDTAARAVQRQRAAGRRDPRLGGDAA